MLSMFSIVDPLSFAYKVLGLLASFYVYFLAYVAINEARRNGKWQLTPWYVKVVQVVVVLLPGLVLDVAFRFTLWGAIYRDFDWRGKYTCTQLMSDYLDIDNGYRGAISRWICDGWLNPMEANHCHK